MKRFELFNIDMPQLHCERTIRVFLPSGYFEEQEKSYPVLYMHDGQNLFDPEIAFGGQCWEVGQALDQGGHEVIAVGIDNGGESRFDEYSPWKLECEATGITKEAGGKGALYSDFIVHTLKPYIDSHYRTLTDRVHTAIAGSSMGGVISLFIGLTYQEVFGAIGAFSVASWTAKSSMMGFLEGCKIGKPSKVFLSVGTEENHSDDIPMLKERYVGDFYEIADHLKKSDLITTLEILDEGGNHNEKCWSRLFPSFITFWRNA